MDFDDALGDRVVAATGAQRGLAAFVIHDGEADAVGLRAAGSGRRLVALPIYLPSMLVSSSVMDRASSGSPVMWAMLRRRVISSGLRSSLSS